MLLGGSSILGAINFIITCLRFRAKGMGLWQMPIFSIATFINSFLILFAFPSLSAALAMLYFDRQFGTSFFNPQGGGDPIVWQHLFWFFGHPEVYILILPAFGIMSEVVPVFSRKPIFGRSSMIVMLTIIGGLGFLVWAHHMFATGLPTFFSAIMAGTSMLIAIPTGVKIFNWLATMWGGSLKFRTPLLFACGLIAMFTVGGITGVTLAVVPWDWQVEDTYYVVGHFHNVLIAGTVFAVFAGIYYWFPKMTGRFLSDRIGKVQFWFMAIGFAVTFFPMYALGILGMPRRVYTYAPDLGWNTLNLISSIGGFILAFGFLLLFYNIIKSLRSGEKAGDNPWRAWTLEWATTSPPPHDNFTRLPEIRSDRPLWDDEHGVEVDGQLEKMQWTDLPREPEQRTITPFWVAFGILILGIGLLGAPLVFIIGVSLILITLAVWMTGRWTEMEQTPDIAHRFSFIGAGTLAFIGSESVFFASLIAAVIHLRIHTGTLGASGPAHHAAAHQHRDPVQQRGHGALRADLLPRAAQGVVLLPGRADGRAGGRVPRRPGVGVHARGVRADDEHHLVVVLRAHRASTASTWSAACWRSSTCSSARAANCGGRPASGSCRNPRRARRGWWTRPPTTGTSSTPSGSSCSSSSTCSEVAVDSPHLQTLRRAAGIIALMAFACLAGPVTAALAHANLTSTVPASGCQCRAVAEDDRA